MAARHLAALDHARAVEEHLEGRDAASFGSSWRRLPAAAFLGFTNVFSPFSAAIRFISRKPGIDMKTSPRTSSSSGGDFPASRSGTLWIVRMLCVTSSPTVPSPRVAATSSEPVAVGQADGEPVELRLAGVGDLALGLQPFANPAVERDDVLARKCVVERKHRHAMPDLREGRDRRAADALRR